MAEVNAILSVTDLALWIDEAMVVSLKSRYSPITFRPILVHCIPLILSIYLGLSSQVGKDVELDAVSRQSRTLPYLSVYLSLPVSVSVYLSFSPHPPPPPPPPIPAFRFAPPPSPLNLDQWAGTEAAP